MTHESAVDQNVTTKPRLLYIDNLRILLTILVIMHHLAIGYGGPGDWAYREQGEMSSAKQRAAQQKERLQRARRKKRRPKE